MFRWNYLVPRLFLLGLVFLGLWLALNPLLHWALVHFGQTLTTARVDLERLETDLARGRMTLEAVELAHPRSPMRNLLEIDRITLDADLAPLLYRRWRLREASVEGLRFGTDRTTSGELGPEDSIFFGLKLPEWEPLEFPEGKLPLTREMLARCIAERLEQFETVRKAREISQSWQQETEQLQARARSIQQHLEQLRRLVEGQHRRPTPVEQAHALLYELESLDAEILAAKRELRRLEGKVDIDRQALAEAIEKDRARLEALRPPESLDTESLSEYFLGEELTERLTTTLGWIQWFRAQIPDSENTWLQHLAVRDGQRLTGLDVLFEGMEEHPDLWIDRMGVDGLFRFRELPIYFRGNMDNLSSSPNRLEKPISVQLTLQGSPDFLRRREEGMGTLPAWVDADDHVAVSAFPAVQVRGTIDRTGEVPVDRFVVECPRLQIPGRLLGKAEGLAIAVSPGNSQLVAEMEVTGGEVRGRLELVQEPVTMEVQMSESLRRSPLPVLLAETAGAFRRIEAEVAVRGPIEKPTWEFQTNLGRQMSRQLAPALANQWRQMRLQALNYLDQMTLRALDEASLVVDEQGRPIVAEIERRRRRFEEEVLAISGMSLGELVQRHVDFLEPDQRNQLAALVGETRLKEIVSGEVPVDAVFDTVGRRMQQQGRRAVNAQVREGADRLLQEHLGEQAGREVGSILQGVDAFGMASGEVSPEEGLGQVQKGLEQRARQQAGAWLDRHLGPREETPVETPDWQRSPGAANPLRERPSQSSSASDAERVGDRRMHPVESLIPGYVPPAPEESGGSSRSPQTALPPVESLIPRLPR